MNVSTSFHDEELTAYLDDELDAAMRQSIETALRTDPALQQRLEGLRIPSDAIVAAFDQLQAAAPAMPDMPPMAPRRANVSVRSFAALAACLLIGAVVGVMSVPDRSVQKGWMEYVAAYQALYVSETLSSVSLQETVMDGQLEQLGEILGRDLTAARSETTLDFKRGQLLGYKGKALVQLAYLSPRGTPVALCIIKSENAESSSPELTRLEGMSAAHWTEDGYAFLLIGGEDDDLIEKASESLSSLI